MSSHPVSCSVREYQKNSYIVHYEHRSIMRPMSTPEVKV
ncbi:hypothetical protein FOTG_14372 [Fusarium oxysporum f. sp. vasinfectum 25433]|uniref:Uncharacterized protein n=1 Tax=Fusarium oxysporum f. sp. vasinfectum 25433 TaxID=1089449 RepID=X0KV10_FUSOX|nr:hypothetical protein FOTG_14372 [Fusarium oxysporum f. sp. vasinfectum 25433]